MQDNYGYMRDFYVCIRNNYVYMQDIDVYMRDNYVYMQDDYVYVSFVNKISFRMEAKTIPRPHVWFAYMHI